MSYVLAFYWIVCGFAIYGRGKSAPDLVTAIFVFTFCMLVGGFAVPALFLRRALR